MSQRSIVPSEKQVLLSQQRTMEQRSSASSTTVRESHTRGQETRVAQQTFTSQQQSTNTTHRVQGAMLQQGHQIQQQGYQQQQQMIMSGGRPSMVMDGSPPVFEQIFRNARFAQGGDAFFEGKVTGNPRPELSWTREGQPLATGGKYQMQYEPTSGKVSLLITHIGPGDEGEYTCTAVNKFGEAICTVYIQPEGLNFPQHLPEIHERSAHTELLSYQTNGNQQQQELYDVDFKVDTFEYRLLREVEFRESLTRRSQLDLHTETETETETDFEQLTTPLAPPQLVQQPRNTKLLQGSDATFQAKLQGNPKPKLTWFMNGARLNPSPRHQFTHSNHLATLKIRNVQPQDAGHYTMFAENAAGCIVSTAFLAVEPSGASNGFSPVDKRAQSRPAAAMASHEVTAAKVPRTASQERPGNDAVVMETGEPSGKALPPQFVRVPADQEVGEGKMVRFDCRITGRPYPDVLWYLNGHQILDDATHKILVNESGNHALMITGAGLNDSGVIQCVARNKGGEASFQVRLSVIEREQVVAPKFVERFTTVHVKEGEPVSLHARAIGTPIPKLTWQKDSVPVSSAGPELSIRNEGGYSALEIPCVRLADAGWYQCTAQNVAGSTATRARLFVDQQKLSSGQPKAMRFPKPTKVIQPQPEPEPEVIYLRHVERARPQAPRREEEERVYEAPIFILPLKDVNLAEGQRAYFEAKVNPAGDPNMRVDWFIDGKPLAASSRVTVTYRFGYISLLLIGVIREDSGVYTCRVSNEAGYADSSATMNVGPRATIESTSQHPESLEQIQMLEDYSRYQRNTSVEESLSGSRPVFVKPLHDLGLMNEGAYAHFEAQIQPVSDPYMRIEWYKDGRSITASSRITTIYNFGYVALNVMHLRAEDAGMYTVKAINRQGEAVSQASIQVATRGTVTGDLGIPEQQRYIERIEELEAYQLSLAQRGQPEPIEATSPPEFKSPIKDQLEIREGGFAHFEARLEPIGDPKLTVHWFKDGKPLEASSRITNFFNFGYVALTIKFITVHDRGVYTCVARNALGEAQTTAKLTVISKQDILLETQHPEGLEKIRYLEDDSRYARKEETVTSVSIKPRFLGPLKGTNKIVEGQKAHFEIRLEPQNDSTLRVEWYFNGKVLMQASRIHLFHDFGYVALDILDVRSEDAGTYTVVARNALGEAQSETTMVVETRSSVDTTSMHRVAYDKAQRLEESKFQEPQYDIEEISKSRPIFVIPLSDPHPVNEGNNVHLECRLEPMGDPTMRVEWYFNGKPITVGSRFKSYFDFGFVALDVIGVTALDSGEYTVRATNHLGTAHTSACVRIIGRSDIMTETQHEGAWEQIQMLEDSSRYTRKQVEEMSIEQIPLFTKPLHNIETVEGTNIHLECRLIPVGDSSMRIDWLVNGQPIRTGHRFRPAFDFDYVALDILSVYPEDSGVYTCRAYNKLGEAVTSSSVRVVAKSQLILESQHPGGLEKIQYLEDASRYKRREDIDEIVAIRPRFLSKPKPQEGLREGQNAHFECKLEPVQDPNLKVEWFKNNCPVTIGSRFRPIHDFGYVALDIIGLIAEDSGVYTCRAQNAVGVDETSATLSCKSSKQIVTEAQRENLGMEKLQYLEDKSKYHRAEESEEICTQAPVFTTSLKTIEIKEGQRAHFECRLIPVSDPTMRVEWFQNNVPLKSGSRFMETNSFGFVALDIMYAYPEDAGTYTCRASNALGQAVTSCQLSVHSKKSIVRETQNQTALSQIQYLEDTSRQQRPSDVDDSTTQAPVFTQPMKNLTLKENQSAHFEARLIPVGDSRLKVEWFKNGVPLQDANRISTLNDFGFVALDLKYVRPDDSGTYTCRATNELGQAVTSATLIVQSRDTLVVTETQHQTALDKLQYLEDTSRYQRQVEEDSVVTEKPKFVAPLNGPTKLVEGQNTHFECRIEPYPDPSMKVEWFHNGKALSTGHRFRTVHDFGFAALDILSVYPEDSGEYTIKATNKLGSCTSTLNIDVSSRSGLITESQHQAALDKILYLEDDSRHRRVDEVDSTMTDKPSFGRPLCNLNLSEGQSAHLEATLVPVNDPTMRVEWYHNGRPISQGHRFRTTYDFGFVALDILYAYAEDSGTYMCKAINANGETVTTCSVTVEGKAGLVLDTLDQQRLTKINELEAYTRPAKEDVEQEMQRPIFTTPLQNLENMKEGDHAHLECRLEPINDPKMRVEWYVNGMAIRTGHRFRATHDFGYVALDVLYTYPEDTGTYMCKAINALGEAVNTCTIQVASRKSIYLDSQHPEGWEKIRALESHTTSRPEEVEEPAGPPRFITELQGTTKLQEGQTAHLECRVEPVRDPKLRVEVFHNGKPLQSASRYHVTCDFGYIALDIKHVLPEDGGKYTVKVINDFGECSSSIDIEVEGRSGLILESQHPQGLDKIRELEDANRFRKEVNLEPVPFQRPVFTAPLQNLEGLLEGANAHLECRLIPVGDPSLKVEWFRNNVPLEDSSRIQKTHDFGYVALDISHIRDEDQGIYMCRATNSLGEGVTTASVKILSKASIMLETQHPEGMRKIRELEEGKAPQRGPELDNVFEKPVFTTCLTGPAELLEGQNAHFECRVVPVGDPSLHFEWYVNGVELKMGSRFRVTHDFGYVTLDVSSVIPEDSGVYMCKAINKAGEAVSTTAMKVRSRGSILGDAVQPQAWQKIQLKETELNRAPTAYEDAPLSEAPRFIKNLVNQELLAEGHNLHLEAQVEPKTDPNLRVEWYHNGVQLMTGSRIRSTFDFGLVSLDIIGLRPEDSGIYVCKAVNKQGEAVSTCTIRVEAHGWLLGQALRPEALAKIAALEEQQVREMVEQEADFESPVFITHLNNVECRESETAHFECRVQPSKDPTMKIEWFVNGKPLPVASRFNATYDFGYVSLDITHVYAEDSGVYTCRAQNAKGQAVSTGTLRCASRENIYLDTQHPQGKAGLEAVHEAEQAYYAKYQRQSSMPEASFPKPLFIIPLPEKFSPAEGQSLHMECHVEPKQDPKLRVEWFFNGKLLDHGSRFKMTNDFGFISLDLSDVYSRDQGVYTCRATNAAGEAFTTTTVYCQGKEGLIEGTQHPKGEAGLEQIQRLEDSLMPSRGGDDADEEGKAPVFTSQFQNVTNLLEGDIAHFEATLTPIGDQTMTVEWFYNGQPLKLGHRERTVHAFGMVVLEIIGTKVEDSGIYTCRATNKWGVAEISVTLECVDMSSGQKPEFTSQIQSLEGLKDGQSAHFECTLVPVGDPNLKVEWFVNGQPLRHSSRIKTVSDFGFVVLDIAYVQSHDSGEYICKASNKFGEDFTRATLRCFGKGGVYSDSLQPDSLAKIRALEEQSLGEPAPMVAASEAPKFITQLTDIARLVEGQSAHFEARLTPVNDPLLIVEWYCNGTKLPTGHRFRTFHDFGIVILDILYCYEEDSGVYECRAVNQLGQDTTRATLKCLSKSSLILDSQLPKGMDSLQKIQSLEDKERHDGAVEEVRRQAPVFTVPLNNVAGLREGENSHFEGRLTPTDDPKLKVEWFFNGKPLKTGSRIRTFSDFGFVILEISPVYPEDSGEYSCRATNDYGEAVTSATLKCQGKRNVIFESQLPKGMERTIERIAELEGLGGRPADQAPETDTGKPPEFLSQPGDLLLPENGLAHFETKLTPVGDPSLRVEWFHNGKPLLAGSRVKTISDFGFVILEVTGVYARDAGLYTCKASNKHGEASVSCTLQVKGRQGIILEPQLPQSFKSGTQSIQKLEENLYKRDEPAAPADEQPNPPRFVSEIKDLDLVEGQAAHFDCRVEPVGDASMRIEWFHNGRPLGSGSRIRMLDDFGFVVLDIDWTFPRDAGEYVCRATNRWGSATTKAKLVTKGKRGVNTDSQLPQGMTGEKLRDLERGPVVERIQEDTPEAAPHFTQQLKEMSMEEGETAHFECRVEPKTDANLRVEWYHNGKLLQSGHRFRTVFELGFVSLDILYAYPEDAGEYVCRAFNRIGEATTKASLTCKSVPAIIMQNQMPRGMKKSETLLQMEAALKKYTSEIFLTEDDIYDADKRQPPRFVTQIKDMLELKEMEMTKFECQLAPVGDPSMRVEWFFNGKPLAYKTRFTPIYDFGYVAMNFGWVYPEDSGEYVCRATNKYGMDETRAFIKTTGSKGIIYDSQLPKGMQSVEMIREMEASWQRMPDERVEAEVQKEKPVFVLKPKDVQVMEGEWARFCCRVTGYPRPRVMWILNGHTVINGTRNKLTYDGMWHLDIPKTRQYDDGKLEVVARNSQGSASCVVELKVTPRTDDHRGVLKNSPKPWYDSDLKVYQKDRQDGGELQRRFEDPSRQTLTDTAEFFTKKAVVETETEWQRQVKNKKNDDYYKSLKQLEENVVHKEVKLREASHQFAIPGEKIVKSSMAKGMAQSYETKLDHSTETDQMTTVISRQSVERQTATSRKTSEAHRSEVHIDSDRGGLPPDPFESSVHGREVHVAKQKQTQKETKGQLEITRKITATETTEVEHKGRTHERVVQGQVKPAVPPFFTKKIQPCRVFEHESARFEVEFEGDPTPTVTWFREDFPIKNSSEFQIHNFGSKSVLTIRQVFMEDSGIFAAVAENRGGGAKCSANLVVEERPVGRGGLVPPSFLSTIQDTSVKAGQLIRFDAKVTGTKPMDIYWLKNGRKIASDIRYKILEEDDVYTLIIIETLPEDSGVYECVAINSAGEGRCEAQCYVEMAQVVKSGGSSPDVKGSTKSSTSAPRFALAMKEQNVPEGQAAVFRCRVAGNPPPQVSWEKDGQQIKPSRYFIMSQEGSDTYVLRISEAFPEDEGTYRCVVTNPSGQAECSASLHVIAPDSGDVPPSLTNLEDVNVVEGSPVQFRTLVSGTPLPTIQWMREGQIIPPSSDFQMIQEGNHAVLLIKTTYPEDSGVYTCRATNPASQVESSAYLTVHRKQARFQRVGHHKGPKTPSDDQTTSSISFKTTGNISVATMSTDEQRRTSRSDVGHQVAPWRRRESSSPPTERIPMVEEAPWRKRSRSEDRRPGQLPVKKNEPAWKQGLQLLKKPQQLKADESLKTSPAWKGGAEMLRKSSPNRKTSLVDTVPPLAPRASADIPWKSGVQLLKKTSRESSPTKTDLPDMPQEANVPWKIGVQMLKKTSRDSSPAAPCQSEGQSQLGVPWKSVKLRKTSGSRDVSPEKRDTTNQSLDVIEWKAGKEMLRKGSPTLAETSHVPAVHKGVDKKESAKAFLTQKLATVAKEQEAISEGMSHKSRDKAKPISIRKVVKDEPIPHVELKPTPQKPKADDKEPIQVVLKKTPSQMKTTSGDSRVVLKPIDQDENLVEKKTEIKSTLKKAEQTETFGRVELKKTPQKPKEIPKADQRVALKPIPQKVEQPKQFEYQTEEFGHEPTDIPDSSKVVFLSSPEELPVELSSTEFLVVKQKPTVTPKPKEGVPKTKPAIPQKPTMVAPESIKPTVETRQRSSVSLESKQDVNKELIPMNQNEQTFEIESENKEEPLKTTTITEQVTLKQLPKSKEAIVTEIVPEIQLKRTPQSPGESKMESSKVELKHITKKDVKPAIPTSKKEERKEQQIELKPVAKSTSMEGQLVVPPSEPLRHEPERITLQTTIAEVKKPVESMPVDQEPDNIVTPWRTKKTLEPTLAKVEDSTESTAFPSESITIDANLPSPAVEPSAIPGKKTRETVDKAEEVPEVILKRTPQKIKQEEAVQENIQLKRVPDKSKDTEESTISLKPIQRRDEQDKVAEVVLKRTPQKSQPEVVEFVGIQLKKVPERKPKEIPERAEIRLKPVVGRQNEEEQQLPPSEEMEVESIQRDVIPQQTVEPITLAKSSLDQVSQVQPTSEKDEGQPSMPTRVPDSAPEAQEAKREVPWRKKIVPAAAPLSEVKEEILVPKPDETTRICISTTVPEPEKTKDVLTETKITLKQPVTPVPKQESQIVSEVLPEETPKTQEQIDSIGPSGSKEISLIPQPSKSVRRSPREPELVQSPQQVVLRRTPQKPKVEEPEPEVIKLKKIPQREVPNATLESQPNIPTSISRVPQKATEITTDATMIVKPITPHKEIEPEVVTEISLQPTAEITTPEEIESVEIEKVAAEPKESPKLVVVGKSLKRSPQQPEQVPIPQQVVLKRTPQKPKQDEPEPEMIKLKKIPRQEVSSVTLTPDSKSEIRLDKVPIAKTELELSPAFTPTHHTETTETEIQSIPDDVTVEAKIDVSPSWRKPRLPSVPAEQPIEEKPLLSAAEPVSVTVVPEIVPADDQTTSSATARLKRTQRKYIPEVLESVPMQIEQEELKPMAAVLDEPVTTTLTTTTTSVQLKRPDVPAITSQSKTEEQTVSQQIKTGQAVSITTTKISKTSHKTELVQSPSVEEKLRLPKVKASISSTPKCQPPSFTKKLQPLSSRTGKKVRLHCQFQGEPQPTITWYRNESVLLASADRLDITTEPTSSVLEISQVVLEDTGIYTCRAVNEAGSAITSANFIVQAKGEGGEAPRFVLPLSPIRASDGEPTKLICTLTGKPIPQITWYCGQREIRPSRDFQPAFEPSTGTASLTITEVFPDDEGIYRCRATNAHGTVECEAPLTVGDMIVVSHQELVRAPVIAQPLEPDIVETGSRKVMTIRFDGYPTPEVKWYHNGREIQQNENRLVTTFKNESTLVIVRCDADSTGKYEARAMNEGGEARTSASIQLGDVKTTAQQPPKFRKALRPQIVPESEAIVMEVEVESVPECVFSWKQHGALIQSTEAMQISTQNNRSTLFIPESFVENSGIYTVKAENPAGSVASTATLTVERQLLAEEFTPPVIVKELPQMKVMDGEEVHLTCQVSGTPMPRIKWYHNGQPVREHNGVMMSLSPQGEAVLRLAEAFPEDAGVYECKAVNRAGQITTSTTLHVERYEYIPDSESASITAGPSVGTWEDLTGPSGSEDDLLSDKPVTKKVVKTKTDKKFKFQPQPSKDEELVQDSGAAPRFTVALPQQVDVKDGHQARFEVKVESYPRSSVFWYLNGKEIQPSKDFGIDHLEDGTSILTLSEVFPDDAGELMCEAHNDKGVVTSITRLNVTEYKDTPTYRKPEWVTRMEIVRAQMLGNSSLPVPRIRLNNIGSDSERSMSIDSATMHELISKCHSMGDVSTGSDSVFISDCGSSRRPSLNNLKPSDYDTLIPHVPVYRNDLGVASASIFAQSVLSGYLQSHRQSITAAIEAIGGPVEDDNKTPTPSSDDESDTSTDNYADGSNDDDEEEAVHQTRLEDDMPRLEVPRTLNFSTMLSPIQENGETPTSESAQALEKPQSLKTSMTDLISAASMEDLKEFLMLETMYDIS